MSSELDRLKNEDERQQENLHDSKVSYSKVDQPYQELEAKFEDKQQECTKLQKDLEEAEAQLKDFQNVLEPAYQEFNNINEKFENEQKIREEAELRVCQVEKDNKKLKRQSQMLIQNLQKLDVSVMDIIGEENEQIKPFPTGKNFPEIVVNNGGELKKSENNDMDKADLPNKIQQLETENKELRNKLVNVMKKNEELESVINNFKRTSTLALLEFEKLQDQINLEILLKEQAVKIANECSATRIALKHQSSVLFNSVASDDKLMRSLMAIEDLTKQLEDEKEGYKKELALLEETIKASKDVERVESLEAQLEISNSEKERLHKALIDLEDWKKDASDKIDALRIKCEELALPPPPPPPPLPPPCPPPPPSIPFVSKCFKRSRSVNTTSSSADSSKPDQLLSDLKQRIEAINTGNKTPYTVRVMRKIPEKGLPPAMLELQQALAKMKTRETNQSSTGEKSPQKAKPEHLLQKTQPVVSRRKGSLVLNSLNSSIDKTSF